MSSQEDLSEETDALVDVVEFARRLGISPERVCELVAQHRLISLERDGRSLYPAFFANPTANIRRLEAVCRRLGALPGGSKWQFFTTPKASLAGRTLLTALRDGDVPAVEVAAYGFKER